MNSTPAMQELRACPFCNSSDVHCTDGYSEDGDWCVYCDSCSSCSGFFSEPFGATEAWNDRVPEDVFRIEASKLQQECATLHARIRDLEAALLSAQAEIARGEMVIAMYEGGD